MPNGGQGVCGHSTVVGQQSYVIFCVGQSMIVQQQFKAWAGSHKIGFKSLKGSYEGVQENSFIASYADYVEYISPAGWTRGQDSVLLLGSTDARDRRPANLVYLTAVKADVCLGLFQSVSKKEALKQDAWTFDPSTNEYFICK